MSRLVSRLTAKATITRNPTAGETGVTTVAERVPCSEAQPARVGSGDSSMRVDWFMTVDFQPFQVFLLGDEAQEDDVIAVDGSVGVQTFTVKKVQRWPTNRVRHITQLLLKERIED